MTVQHNVKMKRIIYKTDQLKVKVTAFTLNFVKKYVFLVQKCTFKGKIVIIIKVKGSNVKVIK